MSKLKARVVLGAALVFAAACEKDPNDPQTWVDKLGDRAEQNEALRHLEHMAAPTTVKPLGEAWKKQNKPSAILRTMISICGTVAKNGGKAAWTDALPYLSDAVENFDQAAARSIDDAVVSCDALGRKTCTVVPPPRRLDAEMNPRFCSTMPYTVASPRPMPCPSRLVV